MYMSVCSSIQEGESNPPPTPPTFSTQYSGLFRRYRVCKESSSYIVHRHQILLLKGAIFIIKHNKRGILSLNKNINVLCAHTMAISLFIRLNMDYWHRKKWTLSSKHNKTYELLQEWLCLCMPQTVFLSCLYKWKRQKRLFLLLNRTQYARQKKGCTQYTSSKWSSTQYARDGFHPHPI